MKAILNYLHELTFMGWLIIIVFAGLALLAMYSQFRKRRHKYGEPQ